jgi:hypothetical protein
VLLFGVAYELYTAFNNKESGRAVGRPLFHLLEKKRGDKIRENGNQG